MKEISNYPRNFKGVWIPKEIYLCSELTMTEKILLMEIDSLDDEKDGCYASNKYLSEFLGVSETSVALGVSKLKKLGLIKLKSFDGRHRILNSCLLKNKSLPFKNLKAAIKNLKAINIDTNIVDSISKEMEEALPSEGAFPPLGVIKRKRTASADTSIKTRQQIILQKQKAVAKPKRQAKTNELVEYWNSLPNTRKHKNPDSNTYRNAVKLLRLAGRGELGGKSLLLSEDSKKKIGLTLLHRELDDDQLKEGIKRLHDKLTPGFEPLNKKWLQNQGLADLIYNTRTKSSTFMEVLSKAPQPTGSTVLDLPKEFEPLLEQFESEVVGKSLNGTQQQAAKYLIQIGGLLNALPSDVRETYWIRDFCNTPVKFTKKYLNWLEEQDWLDNIDARILNPKGKLFRKYLEEEWGHDAMGHTGRTLLDELQLCGALEKYQP